MASPNRKGIILAGGIGSRMAPLTNAVCKQLLPVFDKPMIYYPLCTLMLAGIRDILIITKPQDLEVFKTLFKKSQAWGVNIEFAIQYEPDGIASGLIIAENFLNYNPSALILGDNIFYSSGLTGMLSEAMSYNAGALILAKEIRNPELYGVITLNKIGEPISIEEKPKFPKSKLVVTGLYFYDETAPERAKTLKPSIRGELEITDLNLSYMQDKQLAVSTLQRGTLWFDAGSHNNLLEVSNLVASIQNRTETLISSPEEISYKNGWINIEQLSHLVAQLGPSTYRKMLANILEENR